MKNIRKEKDAAGRAIIIFTQRFLFWTWEVRYKATRKVYAGCWIWRRLPDLQLVPDMLSFRLDTLNQEL